LTRYRVRRGDSIYTIADQFSVSAAEIEKWNHLANEHVTRGSVLRVYPGGMQPPPAAASKHGSKTTASVVAAAKSPQTSEKETAKETASAAVAEKKSGAPATHKVQAGETLWSIAHSNHTTADALREANKFLFTRPLQVGDLLVILPPKPSH
jgi:LysM repeat protein